MSERDTNDIYAEIICRPGFLNGWTVIIVGTEADDEIELARHTFTRFTAALAYANAAMPDFIRVPLDAPPA